jgi:hypothetical protein
MKVAIWHHILTFDSILPTLKVINQFVEFMNAPKVSGDD